MLRLEGVRKDLGDFRIEDISFDVKEGEYFVILGPSGAGKTLLLELIAGIRSPDGGRVILNGMDITGLPPEKRGIAYIPQNYALFPHMTVLENITYGLRVRGIVDDGTIERIVDVLGIGHLLHRKPKTLSGGEQQRVAIARALAVKPKLLLLDEPFSNLDFNTRTRLMDEVKRWRKEIGFTAVHVTHSFEEAFRLADRVGVMMGGRMVQIGRPRDVFQNPKNEDVARFLGYENVFEAFSYGDRVELSGLKLGLRAPEGRILIAIRPEDVEVSKDSGDFEAVLEGVEDLGIVSNLILNVDGLRIKATVPTSKLFELAESDRVYVSFRRFKVL